MKMTLKLAKKYPRLLIKCKGDEDVSECTITGLSKDGKHIQSRVFWFGEGVPKYYWETIPEFNKSCEIVTVL